MLLSNFLAKIAVLAACPVSLVLAHTLVPSTDLTDLPGRPLKRIIDRAVPDTLLQPGIKSDLLSGKTASVERRTARVIRGLLETRQSCQPGYGYCSNGGGCCPTGGRCCTDWCCRSGSWCYATGCCRDNETGCENSTCCPPNYRCCKGGFCCKDSEYCATTQIERGCCPIGRICTGTGGGGGGRECEDSGYSPCSGENFCCPTGATCYRDSSNQPRCQSSSSGGGGTTQTTTRRTTVTGTSVIGLPSSSLYFSSFLSDLYASSTGAPTSTPTPPSGQVSTSILVDDTRITWRGSAWTTDTRGCKGPSRRTTVAEQSFTVIFASVTRIFLNIDTLGCLYSVYLDEREVTILPAFFTSCNYTEVPTTSLGGGGSTQNVNLTLVVHGAPTDGLSNGRKRQNMDWHFQLNEILIHDARGAATATNGPLLGNSGTRLAKISTQFVFFTAFLVLYNLIL